MSSLNHAYLLDEELDRPAHPWEVWAASLSYALTDDGDGGYGPTWEAQWSWRMRRALGWLAERHRVLNWLWDIEPDPLKFVRWTHRFLCRWHGHKPGVFWFNPGGMEPDMHCRGCGANLG